MCGLASMCVAHAFPSLTPIRTAVSWICKEQGFRRVQQGLRCLAGGLQSCTKHDVHETHQHNGVVPAWLFCNCEKGGSVSVVSTRAERWTNCRQSKVLLPSCLSEQLYLKRDSERWSPIMHKASPTGTAAIA